MLSSPIYNTAGDFLGTDDEGLQGKAIVMNEDDFSQGMFHESAVAANLGRGGLVDSTTSRATTYALGNTQIKMLADSSAYSDGL